MPRAFLLELHDAAGDADSPGEVRLRLLLKRLLRAGGFKCVWYTEIPEQTPDATASPEPRPAGETPIGPP